MSPIRQQLLALTALTLLALAGLAAANDIPVRLQETVSARFMTTQMLCHAG
jgi:hypothetical protein